MSGQPPQRAVNRCAATNLLIDVSAVDPLTFAVTAEALAGVVGLASVVPAARAIRIDRMIALRAVTDFGKPLGVRESNTRTLDRSLGSRLSPETLTTTGARWRALVGSFLGWMLDGYDFTILTLVLIDVQRDLRVDNAELGALGTVALLTRLVGGAIAGMAADRWGRKGPMMFSILWFSVFAFLCGFANTFGMLLFLRAMFGLGMGGEWAAGMPLVLEHWPAKFHGIISGVLQGAFSWGFILAAVVFHYAYPLFERDSTVAWRAMLWSGILPALLVFWIRRSVPESPVWLAGQQGSNGVAHAGRHLSALLTWNVLRVTIVLGALMFAYQAMSYWYATLLRDAGWTPLPFLVALNVGGVIGAALWGAIADSRLGRRGAIALASGLSVCLLPLFLYGAGAGQLWWGALLIGLTGAGVIGVAPAYVAAQFDTSSRATGWGVVYHSAATLGAVAPYTLGYLRDLDWPLRDAMATGIIAASLLAVVLVLTTASQTPGAMQHSR